MRKENCFFLPNYLVQIDFYINSPFFTKKSTKFLILGTTKNCILEGAANKKTFKVAVWGHSHKLEAIAPHPDDLAFISAGYDKIVAKWRKQKILWKVNTQAELISAAYHPTANVVAAGSIDGHFVVCLFCLHNILTLAVCLHFLFTFRY